MKIGLDNTPVVIAGHDTRRLAGVLAKYAPEHEYVLDGKRYREIDVYHGFRPRLPVSVWLRRVPAVVTVRDVGFLRHPESYSLLERFLLPRIYRRAHRLIALNGRAGEELAQRLGVDRTKIEVVMPLGVPAPEPEPLPEACQVVRRKYELPERFVLMLGTVEPRHNHQAILEALCTVEPEVGLVICGRRTAWSERLLRRARELHAAPRVEFIYELSQNDLPALLQLARAFVYVPDAELEASVVPIVGAMRAGLPMVLSDTPLNREAAGDAALFVPPADAGQLAAALENVLEDEDERCDLRERGLGRADLFSEFAVAQRLVDIYSRL